jgi:hypothetical protein
MIFKPPVLTGFKISMEAEIKLKIKLINQEKHPVAIIEE